MSKPPLLPGSLVRGLTPLLILFGLAGTAAVLMQLWKLHNAPPPALHLTEKGNRLDPWRPLPGCITLKGPNGGKTAWPVDAATHTSCAARPGMEPLPVEGMTADESGFAPLLRALAPLRTPLQAGTDLPLTLIEAGGRRYPAGANVHLTLEAAKQARAQRLLHCLAGRLDDCAAVGIVRDTWKHHHEGAALRAGALLVMDLKTGAIEVAATSFSPCKTAEERGQPLPRGCPPSARPATARDWKLVNEALFADEMPGSLVKPLHLLALLRSDLGPSLLRPGPAQDKLLENIRKSETPDFLDRLFCKDQGYHECGRQRGLLSAARDLGWNQPLPDLLELAGAPGGLALQAAPGRLLQTRSAARPQWHTMPLDYAPEAARRCAEQPADLRWSKCRTEALANLAAELWGQGNARVSPVAVAAMLARLGAAANGQASIGAPHLLAGVEGSVAGQETHYRPGATLSTTAIAPEHARLILTGMGLTHQPGGTAHSACLHAQDQRPDAARRCADYLGLAGKTGTPVFNHDRLTDRERARTCQELRARAAVLPPDRRRALRAPLAQCDLAPLKWYAALVRDDPTRSDGPWSKIVVALTERNWRTDGRIDAAYDRGGNIAAELVFRYLARS